jgi:hypothetical protein
MMLLEVFFYLTHYKGEGMKTFINAMRILVVTLLFVSLTSLADCCKKSCAPRTCATTGCKLQPEAVKIRKTCDHPGYYKQVCHLEYVPCEGKVEEYTAMPIYKGCYDEQGNMITNGSSMMMTSGETARVQDVDIQVQVPSTYTKATNGRKTTRRMMMNK